MANRPMPRESSLRHVLSVVLLLSTIAVARCIPCAVGFLFVPPPKPPVLAPSSLSLLARFGQRPPEKKEGDVPPSSSTTTPPSFQRKYSNDDESNNKSDNQEDDNQNDDKDDNDIVCTTTTTTATTTTTTASEVNVSSLWNERRDVLLVLGGAAAYGNLLTSALRTSRREASKELVPAPHWNRVVDTMVQAVQSSWQAKEATHPDSPFCILEVGIGSDWKTLRKSAHSTAFRFLLQEAQVPSVELVGVDLHPPSNVDLIQLQESFNKEFSNRIVLSTRRANIENNEWLDDKDLCSPFDVVFCHLVLCSVQHPKVAMQQMIALLRNSGGTLALVEHVAAPESKYPFLAWQQQVLDPLQQAVADNCHLHRPTLDTLSQVLKEQKIQHEWLMRQEFVIDEMWPISYQCRGVVQVFGTKTTTMGLAAAPS